MNKNSKILITGASGMIGGALVRILKENGFTNLLFPTRKELDLMITKDVENYFLSRRPEFVFHLAAVVGGIKANSEFPADFIYNNTVMQANVISSSYKAGCKKVCFPGSACTYPKFAAQPVHESEFLQGQIEPTNLSYAVAKINGIVMAQSFRKQYGLNIIVPMGGNSYGIGDNFNPEKSHVIPALMKRIHEAKLNNLPSIEIWGTGSPLREFIYADDFAEGLMFLMQNYDSSEIINLGSSEEISIIDLAKKLAVIVGFKGKIITLPEKPDGAPRKCLENSKIHALGWKSKVDLTEGLRRMYNYHFK